MIGERPRLGQDWLRLDGLEERWRETPPPVREASPPADEAPRSAREAQPPVEEPRTWAARLEELAAARWGAASPLGRVLAELSRLVEERFAPGGAGEAAAELDARIAEWIGHVEDLAEVQR